MRKRSTRWTRTTMTSGSASVRSTTLKVRFRSQKGAFFSAMRAGLRAHRYAEEVYKMDKNYYDIWVGLGAFNYFKGSLPISEGSLFQRHEGRTQGASICGRGLQDGQELL